MGKDKVVELRHLRDADALNDFNVAKDHLKNAAVAEDRSEDQKRQLLAAEKALIEARQKLIKWESFTRQEDTTLFPALVECHHLLICTTYWVASEGGVKQQAGLKRSWVIVDDLVKLISNKETQAIADAERARAGWGTKGMLESRALQALKPVQGLYEHNIVPYIEQLDQLQGTAVLHSIAWREDRCTGHVCEALVQWDQGGKHEMIGNTNPVMQAISGASGSVGASTMIGASSAGGTDGAVCPGQTSDGVSMLADSLGAATADLDPGGQEPEPEPDPGPEPELEPGPGRTRSRKEESLKHALQTLKLLGEMGEDTAQIEAEIAGLQGEIAHFAENPNSSMRLTSGAVEDIKRQLKEVQDKERAERAEQEKAGRACSRTRDENAIWLWASGAPDGSDGNFKPYAQVVIDVLEGAWSEGEAEQSIYPLQSHLEGTEGDEYMVDMIQMLQYKASDRKLQRRVRRQGAEPEQLESEPDVAISIAAEAAPVAVCDASAEEGIPPEQ
jgi:hypothetical protein